MDYLFATNNQGKIKELNALFAKTGLRLTSLQELGLFLEPEETGHTFEANALIKAKEVAAYLQKHGHGNIAVIADDSGLCVNALGGEPGVDSANFMGRDTPYEVRNQHLIDALEGQADRSAYFACVIACVFPCGKTLVTEGRMHGEIALEICGEGGFGYDPIFYLPQYNQTSAQLDLQEKNKISHRGIALAKLIKELERL